MFLTKIQKESLNSDGHQCHQYQQNKQSPLIPTELTERKKDHDIWRLLKIILINY